MLGILGFMGSYPSREDLKIFMSECRADAKAAIFTVEQVNKGEYDPSHPGPEANQNIQYTAAMAYPTPLIFYSTGGDAEMEPNNEPAPGDAYLEWLKFLLRQPKIPKTISISYGSDERDLPQEYMMPLCKLFAQLGTRGVSVLFASGNDGVGDGDCKDKSGKVQFSLAFPASCTRGVLFLRATSTQAQAQIAYQTTTFSQVPGSLASVARPAVARPTTSSRLRRTYPGAASRASLRALLTRTAR